MRVFFYSGHGAQIPAYGAREEVDHLNECLVPYDFDWTPERAIVDDWFLELYSQLPYDTNFVGILDCCHSGGMTRNGMPKARGLNPPDDIRHRALQWNKKLQMWEQRPLQLSRRKMVRTAGDRKKFLGESGASRRFGRAVSLWTEEAKFREAKRAFHHFGPYIPVLLEACEEEQLSYEYRDGATSYGAFTYCLTHIFRELERERKPATFEALMNRARTRLTQLGYRQSPVLVGPRKRIEGALPY